MRLLHRISRSAPSTAIVVAVGLLSAGCAASSSPERAGGADRADRSVRAATVATGATAARATKPVVVVAAGDIACPPSAPVTKTRCKQGRTAKLASKLAPDAVLALGDLQYESGTLSHFRRSYDKSWGKLRGITYPVPGNHEYRTAGASGYYSYFKGRQPGAPGYYAFNLRGWRVYALNSNCSEINCAKQYEWLKKDLKARPRDCSLFAMHHPRYSSGREHGSNTSMSRFFAIAKDHDVETIVAGHDHHYERFRRMNASGDLDTDGVLSFVSGAGGKSLYGLGDVEDGSAYRLSGHFGVLRLALFPDRFRFAFKDVNGSTPDRGRRSCR